MEFNPHKCEVLRITRKRNPLMFSCTLHNKELNTTNVEYIGVTISNDLNRSNSSHTNNIIAKKQTTHYDSSKETLRPATTTYTVFVKFGGRVFQQTVGIPMGTNCAPLLSDLFFHSYEAPHTGAS